MAAPSVAIIGAGPAGCYTAQAIRRLRSDAEILVIDRQPFPYGLVRYGVAADHQGTKSVTAQFERMFARDGILFAGGVDVGRELSLETLIAEVDLVVWAVGMNEDRRLGIPGENLAGVLGAGEVTRAWNGHPDQPWETIRVAPEVVIVGAGNVAVDLARVLAKDDAGLEGSDLDEVFDQTVCTPVTGLTLVSHSDPVAARWDSAMIRELVTLAGLSIELDPLDEAALESATGAGHGPSSLILHARQQAPGPSRLTLRFMFDAEPIAIRGEGSVTSLSVARGGGQELVRCGTVITAIGFTGEEVPNHERMFRAGWAKTGPRGTIPEQRSAAKELATEIATRLPQGSARRGITAVLDRIVPICRYEDWVAVDAAERAAAPVGRVRRKVRDLTELSMILDARRTGVIA